MRTIKKIFKDDVISLAKNFFALVIVIGICFLPALYAWFNIYSNWDPYGNTGALKFAAVSLDKGYTDDDGVYHNQGDTIIENLHENKAVNWQFVKTADDAIDGVYSGKYYAAVIIDEKFSYNMYNVFSDGSTGPTLLFYENQKKNPVATKISDTVVQTLQTNINSAFVEVVMTEVFSGASDFYGDLENDGGIDGVVDKLTVLHEDLAAYEATINRVISADESLRKALGEAKTDSTYLQNQSKKSANSLDGTNAQVATTQVTLNSFTTNVNATMNTLEASLTSIQKTLNQATLSNDTKEIERLLKDVATDVSNLNKSEEALKKGIEALDPDAARTLYVNKQQMLVDAGAIDEATRDKNIAEYDKKIADVKETAQVMTTISDQTERLMKVIQTPVGTAMSTTEGALAETVGQAKKQVSAIQENYNSQLVPQVNQTITDLENTLANTSLMLNQMSSTFGNMNVMFSSLQGTLGSANESLEKTNEALTYVNERIATAIEKVQGVQADEKVKTLIETLSGNPEAYGSFFSSPVKVTTENVYPVENYGSAVAPFYSTLAFWVGALILTAIIKVHPDKSKYPDASPAQLYFGRYVLYWVLGQVQALIIALGDIYLLKIQCLNKGWFVLAASIIATTFTILIYSLVVTWGDAGKALAVVIVVIQIAGSSGTYPIELLPEFFKKVYIFFPFPYAINAIRECLCGMYEVDYLVYLLQLSIFIIVSLAIGLLIRIPFEEINHYMEERMEETEMM